MTIKERAHTEEQQRCTQNIVGRYRRREFSGGPAVMRVERDEVDARPVKAKPEPVHRDEEGSCHDKPAVIGSRRISLTDPRAVIHGSGFDRTVPDWLAIFGRGRPTTSDSGYRSPDPPS